MNKKNMKSRKIKKYFTFALKQMLMSFKQFYFNHEFLEN